MSEDLTGRRIGAFEVGALLGRGAMGAVYRATDTKGVLGEVAIKVLSRELAGAYKAEARFKREASAALSLEHEGVVRLYRDGITSDGLLYIVMELLPQGTLHELLRKLQQEVVAVAQTTPQEKEASAPAAVAAVC